MHTEDDQYHVLKDAYRTASLRSDGEGLKVFASSIQSSNADTVRLLYHRALGEAALLDEDYVLAIQHMELSLDLSESLGDDIDTSEVLQMIGNIHYYVGSYHQAYDAYLRARALVEHIPQQQDRVVRITSNIGNVLLYSDELDQAEQLYVDARDRAANNSDHLAEARAINNLALVERARGDHEKSVAFYEEALVHLRALQQDDDVTTVLANICESLISLESTTRIAAYLKELGDRISDNGSLKTLYLNLRATEELRLGDADKAWATIQESLQISSSLGALEPMVNAHDAAQAIAYVRNDLQSYVEHRNASDRLNAEARSIDARLKIAFQSKEHELEQIRRENERERALLYGALPSSVADRLIRGDDVSGDLHEHTTVLFLDIVNFTTIADLVPPKHLLHVLRAIFSVCDQCCLEHGLTKIKTIGDSYLAVAGVPEPLADHGQRSARTAVDMLRRLNELQLKMDPALGDTEWTSKIGEISVRIGLHSGPLVAGIVGTDRLQYDVWGDTVNVASRMESTGEPGRIQVSEAFAESITSFRDNIALRHPERGEADEGPLFTERGEADEGPILTERGEVDVKGKGTMRTYWLEEA